MKLQHLRYFTAVVDHGGVVRASERLNMTQPSVSAGLKSLEQELGCALFRRGSGRMRLTQTGNRFYKRAIEILRQCDIAKAEATGITNVPNVRIGVVTTLADRHCAAFAAALTDAGSEPRATFRAGTPERLAQWLKQDRIDVALTVLDDEDRPENARLLLREPFVCLVAESHPFAAVAGIDIRELTGEPFVTRPQCERHRAAQGVFHSEHIAINVVCMSDNDAGALAFVRQGVGVTLAPLSLCVEGLRAVAVKGLGLERCLYLVWQNDMPQEWMKSIEAAARSTLHHYLPITPSTREAAS